MYIQKFKPYFLRNYFADLNHFFMKAFEDLYVLCFTRPRYQVSDYSTTGPLVTIYRRGGHLGHVTSIMLSDFHFLVPERFHTKFGSDRHSGFRENTV